MAYKTRHVVNSLLERAFKEGRTDISPLKVQKILYFLNGWHLAVKGSPIIDEAFEAWQYGPVVPSAYQNFKKFGRHGITQYWQEYNQATDSFVPYVVTKADQSFYEILDAVWERYVGFSALQLSAMTHQPGSAWDLTYKSKQDIIAPESIKADFVKMVEQK